MNKLKSFIILLRPHQYLKNSFVFFPLFFGHKLLYLPAVSSAFWAFLAFCLMSSSVYILNDIWDVEADRQHPLKKTRPLASGDSAFYEAMIVMAIFLISPYLFSFILLLHNFLLIVGSYLLLNLAYSCGLKT